MSTVEPGWVWDQVSDLDYDHAAYVLGLPVGWLKEKAPKGEIPSTGYGKHVRFQPLDITDIRRMHRRNAPAEPDQITASTEYRARLRAALDRAEIAA